MVSLKKLEHVNFANPRVKILLQNMAFPLNRFVHDIPLGESAFNIYQFDLQGKETWITIFKFEYFVEVKDEFFNNEFWDIQD